ncbi:MAG: hypothetical protein ACI9W2_000208, partial [Gammaproteobacteria bacterium]
MRLGTDCLVLVSHAFSPGNSWAESFQLFRPVTNTGSGTLLVRVQPELSAGDSRAARSAQRASLNDGRCALKCQRAFCLYLGESCKRYVASTPPELSPVSCIIDVMKIFKI